MGWNIIFQNSFPWPQPGLKLSGSATAAHESCSYIDVQHMPHYLQIKSKLSCYSTSNLNTSFIWLIFYCKYVECFKFNMLQFYSYRFTIGTWVCQCMSASVKKG